jgi:MFS family permease
MTGGLLRTTPAPRRPEVFDRAYATKIMIILAGLVTTVMYIEGMLTPSLPTIARDFSVAPSQVSLVLSVYLVTGVALSPVFGKLGDIYGKKHVLTAVLVAYTVAVSVTGFSPNFEFMVVARAVQGIGLTLFPLAMSLVREEFPREMVPRAQGTLSALFGAGFAISLPLGSFVSNDYGWRTTYHSAIPFVVAITIACFFLLRESPYRRPETRIDVAGASLLGAALALLVLGLSEGPSWGWSSTPVLAMMLVGAALLLPLVVIERRLFARGREVILDLRLLKIRNVMVANIVVLISGLGMFLAMLALTYQLQNPLRAGGYDLSIVQTGLCLLPFAVGMLIFAPIASVFVVRFGTKPLTVIGSLVGAVGFFLATLVTTLPALLLVMLVVGAGLAIMNASVINLLVLTVEPRDMGLGTSMNAVFRNMGSAIGAPIAGSLMATYLVFLPIPPQYYFPDVTAFYWCFITAAVLFLAAAGVTLFAREILGRRALTIVAQPTGSSGRTGVPGAEASGRVSTAGSSDTSSRPSGAG